MRLRGRRHAACFGPVLIAAGLLLAGPPCAARADGPADNIPDKVRRVPKLGIEVPAEQAAKLRSELDALQAQIDALAKKNDPKIAELLPDVVIYRRAVHDALAHREFFVEKEIDAAFDLLKEGRERAASLAKGESPWATATGLVVRGYVSEIDGSVQPYGLVVPSTYNAGGKNSRSRLDLWFHGRGETLSEVAFLQQRRTQVGSIAPADTIVLHPYGRYSNANKLAGEVDVLEALESVKKRYRIDEDRILVRGFSMGGASTWHLAVHYPDRWAAANPGAGFAETPEFLKFFQKETLDPPWYERKLWQLYDCTDWARNIRHCPTVAYSGENDIQKQAADIMATALQKEGIELVHVIGPKTGHAIHPASRDEIERRLAEIVSHGREKRPARVDFTTYTLKYDRCGFVRIDALEEHWRKARFVAAFDKGAAVRIECDNVAAFTLEFPPGTSPVRTPVMVEIVSMAPVATKNFVDGAQGTVRSDRSFTLAYHREGNTWVAGPPPSGLRKKHGLQGPIDDAFMGPFVFVRPTGKGRSEAVDAWAKAELERAIEHWRRHFRGDARVKDDKDVTDDDVATKNLVLWGDDRSNAVLGRIAGKLPIRTEGDSLAAGDRRWPAAHHAPILIHPNPLNPERYVVLNSGFTFREYDYLNNARQTPKLPDWAIVDVRTPPDSRWPGKIVDADFFGERWELRPPAKPDQ